MLITKISEIKQHLGQCIYIDTETSKCFCIHSIHKLDVEKAKKENAFKDSVLELVYYLEGQEDIYAVSDKLEKTNKLLFTETSSDDLVKLSNVKVGVF